MANCTNNPTKFNCGYFAARDLIDNGLIAVNFSVDPPDFEIDFAKINPEIIKVSPITKRETAEVMNLGCLTCGSCIQIMEDISLGELYPRIK